MRHGVGTSGRDGPRDLPEHHRSCRLVVVRVPPAWWDRVAITWGDGGPAAALRIASCPPSSSLEGWNPYSGGFLLKTQPACIPLTFRVGSRSATVRFGVGKRCA